MGATCSAPIGTSTQHGVRVLTFILDLYLFVTLLVLGFRILYFFFKSLADKDKEQAAPGKYYAPYSPLWSMLLWQFLQERFGGAENPLLSHEENLPRGVEISTETSRARQHPNMRNPGISTKFRGFSMAEDGGFEPPRACTQHAFQACAIGH